MPTKYTLKSLVLIMVAFVSGQVLACIIPPTATIDQGETRIEANYPSSSTESAYLGNGVIYTTEGQKVYLYGFASGSESLSYDWDYGDDTECGDTLNVSHTYNSTGTYVVRFTVTNSGGSDYDQVIVCVEPAKIVRIESCGDEFDYSRIQFAIDMSYDGDVVNLNTGKYFENIYFNGKDITLTSSDPNDQNITASTIIAGDGYRPVVSFDGSESADAVLSGITIASVANPSYVVDPNTILIDPNLVAHWKFNGDPNDYIGGHNGTLYNDPNWVDGLDANSITLDGYDDYVECVGYKGISDGDSRTCTAWIKTTDADGGAIIVWGKSNSPGERWLLNTKTDGTLKIGTGDGNVTSSISVTDGRWHHIAVTLNNDGVNTPKISQALIYIDGSLDINAVGTDLSYGGYVITAQQSNVTIGRGFGNLYYEGLIDDVRIYDRALSPYEISEMYKGQSGGLVSHWKFDDNVEDCFGPCYGTMYGDPTFSVGIDANSLELDGDGDYIDCGIEPLEGVNLSDEWTVACYIKKDTDYTFSGAVCFVNPNDTSERIAIGQNNGNLKIISSGETPGYGSAMNNDQWYHVAMVWDGSQVTAYLDGVADYFVTPSGYDWQNATDLWIGSNNGNSLWDGNIDDVRIFNKALNVSDIQQLLERQGGGIFGNRTHATIKQCVIKNNDADYGGGIAGVDGLIDRCAVMYNTAIDGGGIADCNGLIINSIIADNEADKHNGYGGGLVDCNDIINCTIANNIALSGGGLSYCHGLITNSVIWGNDQDQLSDSSDPNYSCIQDWTGGGFGNIDEDPKLLDPNLPDNLFNYYHIAWNSPCIDAADPNNSQNYIGVFDIDNQYRLLGMAVDMGADEVYDTRAFKGVEGPGITSFEENQGYDTGTLAGGLRWYIDGDGVVIEETNFYQFDPNDDIETYTYQYARINTNTQAYQFIIDDANDHSYFRVSCIPAENSSVNLMFGKLKVASVKFGDDQNTDTIYTLNNGIYENASIAYKSIANQCLEYFENPDPNYVTYEDTWIELVFDVDWGNNTYNVSWEHYDLTAAQTIASYAGFDEDYNRITSIMYDNFGSDPNFLINRVSLTDEQGNGGTIGPVDDNPDFYIYDPNGILDDGRVVGLCDLNGKAWYHMLGEYVLLCCPSDLDSEDSDNWTEIDRRTDFPKDGVVGFWDASKFFNGEYLLKYEIYDDLGRLYNSGNQTRRVYFNNSSEVRDIYYPLTGKMKAQTFVHQEKPDLSVEWPGSFPFELVRTYNNYRRKYVYPFFFGWTHNHNIMLIENCQSEWELTDDPTVPDGDINQLGIGRLWLQTPTGSKMFVCKDNTSTESDPNVVYVADDNSPEYITRNSQILTSFSNGEPNEFDVSYTYYARDGSKMTFDCDIASTYVPYADSEEGLVDWTSSVGIAKQEDRFGNALLYTWVADVNEPSSNNDFKYISKIENNRTDARIEFENDFDLFGTSLDLYSKAKLVVGTGQDKKVWRTVDYIVETALPYHQDTFVGYRVLRSGKNVAMEKPNIYGILSEQNESDHSMYYYGVSDDNWFLVGVVPLSSNYEFTDIGIIYDEDSAIAFRADSWHEDEDELDSVLQRHKYKYDEFGNLLTTVTYFLDDVEGLFHYLGHEQYLSYIDNALYSGYPLPTDDSAALVQRDITTKINVDGATTLDQTSPRTNPTLFHSAGSTKLYDQSTAKEIKYIYTDQDHPTLPTTVYEYYDGRFKEVAVKSTNFDGTILESSDGTLVLDDDYMNSIKSGTFSLSTSVLFNSASSSSSVNTSSMYESASTGSELFAVTFGLDSNPSNASVNSMEIDELEDGQKVISVVNSEYVGGHVRRTDNTYNDYGDITSQVVYDVNEPDLYKATEWDYHPKYGFMTRQTSWQGYGKSGPRVETLWIFGNADGTIDTENGIYLVQEKKLISEFGGDTWAITFYEYYDNGKLKKTTDPEGSITYYEYHDNGVINKIWYDATFDGNEPNSVLHKRFYVDDIGQILVEADSLGGVTINSYDDFGRKYMVDKCIDASATTVSDAEFNPARYDFDPEHSGCNHQSPGSIVYNCDPQNYAGHVSKIVYGYCEYDNIITYEKTHHGGEIERLYTDDGLLMGEYYDDETNHYLVYRTNGKVSDEYFGSGRSRHYGYDVFDRATLVTSYPIPANPWPINLYQESEYYGSGKLKSEKSFKYLSDSSSWGIRGHAYDTPGYNWELYKSKDYYYDIYDNLTRTVVDADFDFPDENDPNEANSDEIRGIITDYVFDAAGNRICVVDPSCNVIFTDYDNANRKVAEYFAAEPVFYADSNDIDIDSTYTNVVPRRTVEYYDNDKVKNVTAYDYDGTTVLAYSEFEYDGRGRITKTTQKIDDANDAVTTINYYDAGVLDSQNFDAVKKYHIKITDAEGKVTYIGLDAFGNRTKTVYSSGDSEEMEYNGDGTLARKAVWDETDTKEWINYHYDAYGKISDVNYPDTATPDISFIYECDALGWVKTIYDRRYVDNPEPLGRLEGDRYDFTYDGLDNITSYTYTPYDSNNVTYTIEYKYHYADNQKKKIIVKDASGNIIYRVKYNFDDAGRMISVSDPNSGSTYPIAEFGYDLNGNRNMLDYYFDSTNADPNDPNNISGPVISLDYMYNRDNLLTSYETLTGPTFTFDADDTGGIDGMGRLKNATETLIGTSGTAVEHDLGYTYDGMGQLVSANVSNIDGSNWQISYTYAKDGNIQSLTLNGDTVNFGYTGDMMTNHDGTDIDWDVANGTTSNNLTASFAYDWDNKLSHAEYGTGESLDIKYDPRGNRIYRSVGTAENKSERQYIIDIVGKLPVILCEIDLSDCSLENRYYYANSQILAQDMVSSVDPEDPNNLATTEFARYYYLHDRLGSVRMVVDPNLCITDPNGAVVNTYTYEPFGETYDTEVIETVYNPFMFTGQWYDQEIAQYYLRARQYDPSLMRLTGRDSYWGNLEKPLSLHRYLYCWNNSVNVVDPSGELGIAEAVLTGYEWHASAITVAAIGVETNSWETIMLGAFMEMLTEPVIAIALLMPQNSCDDVCFTENTLIYTPNGLVPIRDIQIGQNVWAYNNEIGQPDLFEVVKCFENEVDEIFVIYTENDRIETTKGHLFYVHSAGWCPSDRLQVGDELIDTDGKTIKITYIELLRCHSKVYNFEVADSHTYYVSQSRLLVHNKGCGGKNGSRGPKRPKSELNKIQGAINQLDEISKAQKQGPGIESIQKSQRRVKNMLDWLQGMDADEVDDFFYE